MSEPNKKRTVAVVGASRRPKKYGNKSVKAHLRAGYDVYPVNPHDLEIEGLKVYRSVLDIPVELDRVTMYVGPDVGMQIIEEIARKGTKELFFNPGSESPELVRKAESLGLKPVLACSIVDVGFSPDEL